MKTNPARLIRAGIAFAGPAAVAWFAACSDNPCCGPPAISSITVTPPSEVLVVGATVRLSATLRDANGQALFGYPIDWHSNDATVAAVDSTGLVKGVGPGAAKVIATSAGVSGTAAITVSGSLCSSCPPSGISKIAFASGAYLDAPIGGIKVMAADLSSIGTLTTSGNDWDPAWSPDGSKIAFASDRARALDHGDIFVVNSDGSGLVRLTSDEFDDREPAWSPDGRRIAFERGNYVYVMNAIDGSALTAVTLYGTHPQWSPDGSRIVFAGTDSHIWVTNPDGSRLIQLTAAPGLDDTPAWSPDGRRIAFRHRASEPGIWAIYLMNSDGTGVEQLTVSGQRPAWSPDSRMLAYEDSGIYVINVDGSGLRRLGDGFAPAWSRIGSMPPLRGPWRFVTIVGGDGQQDGTLATLPEPLSVRVTDTTGTPVPEVMVQWILDSLAQVDGSAVSAPQVPTDASGIASVRLTLGRVLGPVQVRAAVTDGSARLPGVVFTTTVIPMIHVSVSPESTSVPVNWSQQFVATVTEDSSNAGVIWSLEGPGCSGAACGTLSATTSSSGNAVTYTAPPAMPVPATVTVRATSVSDATKSAVAAVTIGPPIVAVSVTPSSASVALKSQQEFVATVLDDSTNAGVTWTLSGPDCSGDACGMLSAQNSQSGVANTYTAPAKVPNGAAVTLTATSVADPTKTAEAVVTITSSIQVSITPTGFVGVDVGNTLQLTASLNNDADNLGVTWTVSGEGCSGAACGTISATGLYTAPATVPVPASVTVTATSVADYTKAASVTVVITVPGIITVVVSPTSASICYGYCRGPGSVRSRSFTAYVFNDASNAGVSWSAGVGSLSSTTSASGVPITYTGPSSATGSTSVTATSIADGTKSASATVRFVYIGCPRC